MLLELPRGEFPATEFGRQVNGQDVSLGTLRTDSRGPCNGQDAADLVSGTKVEAVKVRNHPNIALPQRVAQPVHSTFVTCDDVDVHGGGTKE